LDAIKTLDEHSRIIWALMLRELATRYGRNNLGFLWVIAEPMTFCVGVLILWRTMRGPYENGISVIPFVLTGYMPTILVRHVVSYSVNAVKINGPLLYHRRISILDLYLARIGIEFVGVSLAFVVTFGSLLLLGLAPIPYDIGIVYEGWLLISRVAAGMALLVGALSELIEVVERIISVTLYILVPLSGTFFLADWLPPDVRKLALSLPFLNCAEIIRYGFFGPSIHPHFDVGYTLTCGAIMLFLGLVLVRQVKADVQ
jgi:capsular polysaccharide transport system permease protein